MRERRFYLDIGGGTYPDFFIDRSKRDPWAQYVVLDPTILPVENKPANLHLIRWQRDAESDLPFPERSIDKIFLNNVCHELRTDGCQLDWRDTETIFENGYHDSMDINRHGHQLALYDQILASSRRVLKPGGSLTVVEPAENIPDVLHLCLHHGFYVYHKPKPVLDPGRSTWTKWFHEVSRSVSDRQDRLAARPTQFVVRL